jgi:hypothetical protein
MGTLLGLLATVLLFNVVVDPFNRNQLVELGLPKERVSTLIDYQIFKILEFKHEPRPVIILGDSRSEVLRTEYFAELGRNDVFNFAYGAGTLYEAIDTFWLAVETARVEQVIFGVPFSIYSEANSMNRFPTARQVSRSIPAYYLSPLVTKASLLNLLTAATGRELVNENPDMSREDFWRYQLGPGTARHYERWSRPKVLLARLEEVVRHCHDAGITLVFWIPPTHVDMQAKLTDYGLAPEYERYKGELRRLGPVLDYDLPDGLTADADNFSDPQHFNDVVARQIVADLVASLRP